MADLDILPTRPPRSRSPSPTPPKDTTPPIKQSLPAEPEPEPFPWEPLPAELKNLILSFYNIRTFLHPCFCAVSNAFGRTIQSAFRSLPKNIRIPNWEHEEIALILKRSTAVDCFEGISLQSPRGQGNDAHLHFPLTHQEQTKELIHKWLEQHGASVRKLVYYYGGDGASVLRHVARYCPNLESLQTEVFSLEWEPVVELLAACPKLRRFGMPNVENLFHGRQVPENHSVQSMFLNRHNDYHFLQSFKNLKSLSFNNLSAEDVLEHPTMERLTKCHWCPVLRLPGLKELCPGRRNFSVQWPRLLDINAQYHQQLTAVCFSLDLHQLPADWVKKLAPFPLVTKARFEAFHKSKLITAPDIVAFAALFPAAKELYIRVPSYKIVTLATVSAILRQAPKLETLTYGAEYAKDTQEEDLPFDPEEQWEHTTVTSLTMEHMMADADRNPKAYLRSHCPNLDTLSVTFPDRKDHPGPMYQI